MPVMYHTHLRCLSGSTRKNKRTRETIFLKSVSSETCRELFSIHEVSGLEVFTFVNLTERAINTEFQRVANPYH